MNGKAEGLSAKNQLIKITNYTEDIITLTDLQAFPKKMGNFQYGEHFGKILTFLIL